ncbi:hypothetical protein HYH03_013180 [Edaphochlamys debaryana]|uniref:Uncharacterized protein n=1 Tax=Edaphochlamys debaryana TaxID=47281 RepID=A0A835XWV9_9CHLO|nr:hypothetical protein HYH03_013180 [Edaphochlamys debaryana]|eukprot:KAG2488330.1 hypothetical protein HYH03_013180 [Edaphochlamys debaryana]
MCQGDVALVRKLLEDGLSVAGERYPDDWTPLLCAVEKGHVEVAKVLIEAGADVHAYDGIYEDDDGRDLNTTYTTPLHLAVSTGNAAMVKMLLEAKAVPRVRDRKDQTPIHIAAQKDDVELIRVLAEAGGQAVVNAGDQYGYTPLHHAAMNGHEEAVKALLAAGADRNATSWSNPSDADCFHDGPTPL